MTTSLFAMEYLSLSADVIASSALLRIVDILCRFLFVEYVSDSRLFLLFKLPNQFFNYSFIIKNVLILRWLTKDYISSGKEAKSLLRRINAESLKIFNIQCQNSD